MSLNVLVVDDSAVMRSMVAKALGLTGLDIGEIFNAANGQEGLDILESHWVDLALVDINMPVMNGVEMIERLRDNSFWKDLPVIVVSTEGSETRIAAIRKMGVEFVHKPFTPEIIRALIQDMTGSHHEQPAK